MGDDVPEGGPAFSEVQLGAIVEVVQRLLDRALSERERSGPAPSTSGLGATGKEPEGSEGPNPGKSGRGIKGGRE